MVKQVAKKTPIKRAIDHWPPILAGLLILDFVLLSTGLVPAGNSTLYALVSPVLPWLLLLTFLTALVSVSQADKHHAYTKLQQLNLALVVLIVGLAAFWFIGIHLAYGWGL